MSFLSAEVDICLILIDTAKRSRKFGSSGQYETSKHNVVTITRVINRLKGRLPKTMRAEIDSGHTELLKKIAEL